MSSWTEGQVPASSGAAADFIVKGKAPSCCVCHFQTKGLCLCSLPSSCHYSFRFSCLTPCPGCRVLGRWPLLSVLHDRPPPPHNRAWGQGMSTFRTTLPSWKSAQGTDTCPRSSKDSVFFHSEKSVHASVYLTIHSSIWCSWVPLVGLIFLYLIPWNGVGSLES